MTLKNLVIHDAKEPVAIQIADDGTIGAVSNSAIENEDGFSVGFEAAIAFPGLINSHDHLDFNAFPLLGNGVYDHYVPWGADIHHTNRDIIQQVLKIPKELRVQWSLYKNLLNGITTVVQHGERFPVDNDLVDVFQDCISIHSVRLEKGWKFRLNKPRVNNRPVVIHTGEGTNAAAHREIDKLIRWNFLKKSLIGIHGIAMTTEQARAFKALIWCPDSNYFLFQKTADIPALKGIVPVIFGTDSTLTAHWAIWKHIRMAMNTGFVTGPELYDMLTKTPAAVWGFKDKGEICPGWLADIVIARKKHPEFMASFLALDPEDILLVLHRGTIRLFDDSLLPQLALNNFNTDGFSKISIGSSIKYVYGNLPGLIHDIRKYYPGFNLPGMYVA